MNTFKPFDPDDIDESLTRVVAYGGHRYLLFPYVNATGAIPEFNSISNTLDGAAATIKDFAALSALVRRAGGSAKWLISFNTPWLIPLSEVAGMTKRAEQGRVKRKPGRDSSDP